MHARKLVPWSGMLLFATACGGKNSADTAEPSGTGPSCQDYFGTADACLNYESEDCSQTSVIDGGWFDDSGGQLFVQLAPNSDGLQLGFEVPDAANIADGTEFLFPTEAILHLTDPSTDPPSEYWACQGKLTITNYTPGEILWGTWSFQARGVTGVCGESDYYASMGEFINLEPCN